MVAVALCWAPLAVSTARGEDGTQDRIAAGTVVCFDRAAVDDILAIVRDPDVEEPARRLTLILSSGECSNLLVGEPYEAVEVENSAPRATSSHCRGRQTPGRDSAPDVGRW
jgi:hypothetical protein